MYHIDHHRRFPSKIIGWKNWIQKSLEAAKTPNESNQNPKTQLSRTVRLVSEQPFGLLTQEIEKDALCGCESTNSRTMRPVNAPSFSQSCVPVSVERLDKDKDADENVDADQNKNGETRVHRRRFPTKIIWTCNWDSDVARSSIDIQRVELKPNTQLSSTGRPVTKWSEETLERTKFDRDTFNQEKHDSVTDPTSTVRPECWHESTERCVLTLNHVENDQTSTVRPVTVDQKEERHIDFRVPGLPHSVLKEPEHLRVQELVQRIENHPHREALHADIAAEYRAAENKFERFRAEARRDFRSIQGNFIYRHHIEPRVQLTCPEESFLISQDLHFLNETPPRRNIRCGRKIGVKPKISEAKQIQLYLTLQGKDEIVYSITTLRTNSFRWKDLKKALHLIPFEGESKHMMSRLEAQRVCETKFFE